MYLSINGDEEGDNHGGDKDWNVDGGGDDDDDSDEEEKEEEDGDGDDNDGTYLPRIL